MFAGDQLLYLPNIIRSFKELYEMNRESLQVRVDLREHRAKYYTHATGVVKSRPLRMFKMTTEKGYSVRCTSDQLFKTIDVWQEDDEGNVIMRDCDKPLSKFKVGDKVRLLMCNPMGSVKYQPMPDEKPAQGDYLTFLLIFVAMFPERFIREEEDGKLGLILDTVITEDYFNYRDLEGIRCVCSAISKYIEKNDLQRMRHLHYTAYKSHKGDAVYVLGWLQEILEKEFKWDINNPTNYEALKCMYCCTNKKFMTLMKYILFYCFVSKGNRYSNALIFNESREFLQAIQSRLLLLGIVSSIHQRSLKTITGRWRKGHAGSYYRYIVKKSKGDGEEYHRVWVLEPERNQYDMFNRLFNADKKQEASVYRKLKLSGLRTIMERNNKKRRKETRGPHAYIRDPKDYWDTIESIEPDGVEEGYRVSVPEYKQVVVGGIICHD